MGRGGRVIAGDHHHRNARVLAQAHRFCRLGPRRIDQAEQAEELEFGFDRLGRARGGQALEATTGECDHPQAVGGHALGELQRIGANERPVRAVQAHAMLQHPLRRALHQRDLLRAAGDAPWSSFCARSRTATPPRADIRASSKSLL